MTRVFELGEVKGDIYFMVRIVTLVENTTSATNYQCKHGLCLYIETVKHKILFDLGQDNLFVENARKMNIDISEIDIVIISHGHKDHGGALKHFLKINSKAKIYIRNEAFEPHYIKVLGIPVDVGLDEELKNSKQIMFTNDVIQIDEELTLFSNVKNEKFIMKSNDILYVRKNGTLLRDDFCHEQNLIITNEGHKILISGCSHAGIVNILNKAEELIANEIDTVVGGFHLYNPPTKKYESNKTICHLAKEMNASRSVYFTCHCTGIKAYKQMKNILGKRLSYLSVGTEIQV